MLYTTTTTPDQTPPEPHKTGYTGWLPPVAYPGNPGKHNLGPSPATTVYKTPLACHLAANITRLCGRHSAVHLRSKIQGPAMCLRSTVAVTKEQPKARHTGRHTRDVNPGTPHTKHTWVQHNRTSPHPSARTLYRRCRQTQHTHGAHNRRTHRLAHNCTMHGYTATWLHTR